MAQRYVRVQSREGQVYYGLLQLSLDVQILENMFKGKIGKKFWSQAYRRVLRIKY